MGWLIHGAARSSGGQDICDVAQEQWPAVYEAADADAITFDAPGDSDLV